MLIVQSLADDLVEGKECEKGRMAVVNLEGSQPSPSFPSQLNPST